MLGGAGAQAPARPPRTPPQAKTVWRVTQPDRAAQKNETACATSSPVPIRRIGTLSTIARVLAASGGLLRQNASVAMGPGATQLTVMPKGASSSAQVRAIDWAAPLVAL